MTDWIRSWPKWAKITVPIATVLMVVGALVPEEEEDKPAEKPASTKTAESPKPLVSTPDPAETVAEPSPAPEPSLAQKATKILKQYGWWKRTSIAGIEEDNGNLTIFTELYAKPENEPRARGICSTLIGTDPPEIDVSGWIMVWSVTADAEIDVDECDTWYWDEIYGR